MGYIMRVTMLLQVKAVGIKDSPCACGSEVVVGCGVRAAGVTAPAHNTSSMRVIHVLVYFITPGAHYLSMSSRQKWCLKPH